ncbi:PP2C family protein-serine/threonine phosphatase [Microbacterium pygmaeum]|uniref:Protein phosphatase n=1 Tax=Microbacterium pygmaeum TaxID=370764 RepID=A0A1G7U5X4_9MICO|nr:protein phosphatase 2C domain-containing protein [Microbacterium pygmaeum]SDG43045.1 protein phosphatase [Microbacterium pygmaeum]
MSRPQPPIVVAHGAATDAGLRRRVNEDSFLAAAPLFLVADGMGGHQAGEVASAAVIEEFARLAGLPALTIEDVQLSLRHARRRVAELPLGDGAGAGTTLSGVVVASIEGEGYWLALNLGDSRTYRLSEDVLEQISVDHSVVQELIDSGELDEASAAIDTRRNVITRAIGGGSDAQADYWLIPADEGDRILICSDGLSGELDRAAIEAVLRAESDPQAAATRLVHEAMLRGGRDNITAIVVDALQVRARDQRTPERDTLPGGADAATDDIDSDTRPRVAAGGTS